MVDVDLQVSLTRAALGLGTLELNDHVNYAIAPGSFGGQVTWQRNTVSSPYMDDEITTFRHRGKVQENIVIEVYGSTPTQVQTNVDTLIRAIVQSSFDLILSINGQIHTYGCETADYQMSFDGNRFVAKQMQVKLTVPRSPVPKAGVL